MITQITQVETLPPSSTLLDRVRIQVETRATPPLNITVRATTPVPLVTPTVAPAPVSVRKYPASLAPTSTPKPY